MPNPFRPYLTLSLAALGLSALGGCMAPSPGAPDRVTLEDSAQLEADRRFVREPFEDQMRQGVLRQRSLGARHFRIDSAELSDLGRRDLAILAEGMRDEGGRISVARAGVDETLYAARLARVRTALASDGIAPERIELGDGPAGGTGTFTADALVIRERIAAKPLPPMPAGQVLSPFGN